MTRPSNTKGFTIRLEKDLWRALKNIALDKEIPLNTLIINALEKIRNRSEKRVDEQ